MNNPRLSKAEAILQCCNEIAALGTKIVAIQGPNDLVPRNVLLGAKKTHKCLKEHFASPLCWPEYSKNSIVSQIGNYGEWVLGWENNANCVAFFRANEIQFFSALEPRHFYKQKAPTLGQRIGWKLIKWIQGWTR